MGEQAPEAEPLMVGHGQVQPRLQDGVSDAAARVPEATPPRPRRGQLHGGLAAGGMPPPKVLPQGTSPVVQWLRLGFPMQGCGFDP